MSTRTVYLSFTVAFGFLVTPPHSPAADKPAPAERAGTSARVAYQPAPSAPKPAQRLGDPGEIVFSAAPRGDAESSQKIYGPLAEYLSKITGKKVVYKYPGTWGAYQASMVTDAYDLMYDGPHFNGWRAARLQHQVLAKIPNELVFVTVVKKDNDRISSAAQLAGRTVCAHAPPNLGTLTLLSQFDNPVRLPVIIVVNGWDNIYSQMMAGKCVAALIPQKTWEKQDRGATATRLVFKSKTMPNQAFSAGPRISIEDKAKIAKALTSSEALPLTEAIRSEYGASTLVPAANDEYVALGDLLKNEWGYQ